MSSSFLLFLFMLFTMFILGTCIGSFLNVCIYRIPNKLSVIFPPSHCPSCETQLKPLDLIPLLSWLAMKGKCKYCKAPIGIQYPFFEFVTGCLTALLSALIVDTPTLVIALLLLYNGLVIAAIDFKYQIIPNRNNLFFLLIGIGLSAYRIYLGQFDLLIDGGFGFLIAFSTMFLLVMLNVWGAGDLKMMSAVGLIIGFKLTLLTIWLGILLGAVMGLFLICIKNKSRKDKMAFGPALVAGMMISYVFGTDIINSYLGYFL